MIEDFMRRFFLGCSALAAAADEGSGGPGAASAETLKRLAYDYYKIVDRDGPAAGKPFMAPGYAYRGANHTGFTGLTPAEMAEAFFQAFPDFTHVVLDQIADGDIVAENIRYFATHSGEFMGIPATGRKITFTGMDWVRFEGEKMAERWGVANEFDVRRQLLGLPDPRETETNKQLAREYYQLVDREGIPGSGPYEGAAPIYYGANHTGFDANSPQGLGNLFYTAFPDFTHVIMDQVAEGNVVVERIRYFATHSGEFMKIPATGRKITFTGMDWVWFEDGQALGRWGVANEFDLRRQLLGEPDPRPDETAAILASDRAIIRQRYGENAAQNFDRL